jgi:putative ABC transport system substrate-binding protein
VSHAGARLFAVVALALGIIASPGAAGAQVPGGVHRVGILWGLTREESAPLLREVVEGLRELGYREGRNVVFEHRFAGGKLERLPELATELVALRPAVIIAGVPPSILALKRVTATVPIVMGAVADPVEVGVVASLARPGGNVTGVAISATPEQVAKGLQILKEAVPRLGRVAVLWNPDYAGNRALWSATEAGAASLGITLLSVELRALADFEAAFARIARERPDGFAVIPDTLVFLNRARIVEAARRERLPAVYPRREFAEAGGLLSYGASLKANFRRTAYYVDKLLRGARAADLPVEMPTRFEVVVNLRTAKALGLTIPPAVLARADEVIE